MEKRIEKIGNGWQVEEWNGDVMENRYMVYEDPTQKKKLNISEIDVDTITDEELGKLARRLKAIWNK